MNAGDGTKQNGFTFYECLNAQIAFATFVVAEECEQQNRCYILYTDDDMGKCGKRIMGS